MINKYPGTTASFGYSYVVPMEARPDLPMSQPGSYGLDLLKNKPYVTMNTTSAGTGTDHTIRTVAYYKCLFVVNQNKTVDYKITNY